MRRNASANSVALNVRNVLYAGDIISTGPRSGLTLLFINGAQVRVNANTTLTILAPEKTIKGKQKLFRVQRGEVWARLRPNDAIQTDTAIAGVRGTEIDLNVADDGTTVLTVLEGEVDFFNQYGEVTVRRNEQSVARPGTAPTTPVSIQNPGFIIEWTLDLSRSVIAEEKFFVTLDKSALKTILPQRAEQARQKGDNANARRDYGDVLFDSGLYEAALNEYEAANRLAPGQPTILTRHGYALLRLDRLDDAASSFRSAHEAEGAAETAAPWTGLAWMELLRANPAAAQPYAERAVAAVGQKPETHTAEAYTALGVALTRQPGKLDAALAALREATKANDDGYRYQARSWLALALLAQDDRAAALVEAQAATQLAPWSGLAHGNLSLVDFFAGRTREAVREAQRAVALNPQSIAARVTLGQALLARGDVDEATKMAAQAVAQDPGLVQARYLLGIAEASGRDYAHAARDLRAALLLEPDFLPAVSALARVYNYQGRRQEAVALLNELLPRHRDAAEVQGALAEIYYQQSDYKRSAAAYRQAIALKPNSAFFQANLARVLLDANQLQAAIVAGQQAVRLAPEVGQYHAMLGLAYAYGGLDAQAEREFRTALTFDPQNALALGQLARRARGADLRAAESARSTQAFLFDPDIARQLLRGGIHNELTPTIGNRGHTNFDLDNRADAADGRLHSLIVANLDRSHGPSINDDSRQWSAQHYLTWVPEPRTNLFSNLGVLNVKQGLPGFSGQPDADDRSRFRFGQAQLAGRRRMGAGRHLWLGLFGNDSHYTADNADRDSFFSMAGFPIDRRVLDSDALEPELRYDLDLTRRTDRPGILTLGASYANTNFDNRLRLIVPASVSTEERSRERDHTIITYGQLAQRVDDRLSFIVQLREQHLKQRIANSLNVPGGSSLASESSTSGSQFLPSLLLTYQAARCTTLRFSAGRVRTDVRTSTFAPVDTLVITESETLPVGTPLLEQRLQIDLERYFSARDFGKLFVFDTTAHDLQIGGTDPFGFGGGLPAINAPALFLSKWRGYGLGARYERQLSRSLFVDCGVVLRHTTAFSTTGNTFFDNRTAPYEPDRSAHLNFNYIDRRGNKMALQWQHVGSFFQDSPLALGRPRFPARTYVDLLLAREPTVHHELFLRVANLLNSSRISFNGFEANQRRVEFGVTRRF